MSGWISVKDRLPEDHEYQYLFWNSETDNYELMDSCDALNSYVCGANENGDVISDEPYYIEMGITHWMELPFPPTI